ncbi:MAG: hypothetical protein CL393_09565 [Acidiferrobacteraceae bacterium]|jgi:GT2 family glycosyltransferase|nr:hypothetical protein [Acidiferrobacteraceae bacterium]
MFEKVNIIIPAIELDDELLNCLKEISKIDYSNFFVTIVLDRNVKSKLTIFKYKINKMVVGKMNMSKKRNLAAKKFKSKYIAFIDSDAYPNVNWLKNATKHLSDKKIHIVGGPNIPFKNQNYSEKISHYCKRSFFVTGHLNYRKYMSKKRICTDWLEACNLIMRRNFFLKFGGMNEKSYFQEDQEFFDRLRRKIKNFRVLFTPDVFVYHKERKISKFLLQRLSFGTALLEATKFSSGIKGLIPSIPIVSFFIFVAICLLEISLNIKIIFFSAILMLINLAILYEISKYIKSVKDIILTIIIINFSSLLHIIGGLIALIGLRKFFERRLYVLSRTNV